MVNAISFTTPSVNSASFLPDNTTPNYLSGIQYFVDAKADFTITASNVYKNVYSTLGYAIEYKELSNAAVRSISVTGSGIVTNSAVNSSSRSLPNLNTGVSSPQDQDITITSSF